MLKPNNDKKDGCIFCSPIPYLIMETDSWRVHLNLNQSQLGRMIIVLNRHIESLAGVAHNEFNEIQCLIKILTNAVKKAFNPELVNYAFLGNEVRHLHMHVVPRYKSPIIFADTNFVDEKYGRNFGGNLRLPKDVLEKITKEIQDNLKNL